MLYKKKIEYEDYVSSNLMQKTIITTMSMTIEILAQRIDAQDKRIEALEHLVAGNDKKAKKAKKAAKAAASSDNDEPKKKKKKSGYLLFSAALREDAKEKLSKESDSDDHPKSTTIMKQLGAMWKALSDEERTAWNDKSKELDD